MMFVPRAGKALKKTSFEYIFKVNDVFMIPVSRLSWLLLTNGLFEVYSFISTGICKCSHTPLSVGSFSPQKRVLDSGGLYISFVKVCSVITDPMKWAFSLICLVKNLLFATVITRKAAITSTTPIPTERQMISWSPLTLPCPSNEKPQKE